MQNSIKKKVIFTIIEIILFVTCISNIAFAGGLDPVSIISTGPDGKTGVGKLNELGNAILGIIQYVGLGVAVIAALVLGMRYMYSSPDEKAEIKKKLIPFIIGGFMVFGAIQLVKIVEIFVGEIVK